MHQIWWIIQKLLFIHGVDNIGTRFPKKTSHSKCIIYVWIWSRILDFQFFFYTTKYLEFFFPFHNKCCSYAYECTCTYSKSCFGICNITLKIELNEKKKYLTSIWKHDNVFVVWRATLMTHISLEYLTVSF